MASSKNGNIRKYRKPLNINIGILFFSVILVYLIICIVIFFTQKNIVPYEVKSGSLSVSNVYEGIALRNETIVNSDYSGYINYYAREGEKAGCNNLVCAVDETGQLQDMLNQNDTGEADLSDKDLTEIKNDVINYVNSFTDKSFGTTYDFKFTTQGSVVKFSNRNLLNNLNELSGTSESASVHICTAPLSGIVVYSTDGYEQASVNEVSEEWFKKENYTKEQLINNDIVETGDPIYKLVTDENWEVIIPVDNKRAKELEEAEYVKVKFLKNQYESWGKVSVIAGADGGTYVDLAFNNSMLTFATDRYVDIELITDVENGLKVPNSAIVKKEFFLIPQEYLTKGGNGSDQGVLRETYNEDGSMIPEFVPLTIYNMADGECYVDDTSLRIGDNIDMPDSTDKFTISKSGTLIGVYNINKGYADFKQIQILNQNEEYAIIKSNTDYGLVAYDYIVLDAASVNENDFIYE